MKVIHFNEGHIKLYSASKLYLEKCSSVASRTPNVTVLVHYPRAK